MTEEIGNQIQPWSEEELRVNVGQVCLVPTLYSRDFTRERYSYCCCIDPSLKSLISLLLLSHVSFIGSHSINFYQDKTFSAW